MPATSLKQKKFMDAVAHNPQFAKKAGVPQSVGKDFSEASKGMKFGKGSGNRADAQAINKPKTNQGKSELFAKGGEMAESKAMMKKEVSFMKKKGAPATMIKHEEAEMKTKKMAKGGITSAKMGKVPSGGFKGKGEHAIQKSGISKGTMVKMSGSTKGLKKGGKC
jgi:23S rRNA A1618 N6-methylase RlmF